MSNGKRLDMTVFEDPEIQRLANAVFQKEPPPVLILEVHPLGYDSVEATIDFCAGSKTPPTYRIPIEEFDLNLIAPLPGPSAYQQLLDLCNHEITRLLLGMGRCLRERAGYIEEASPNGARSSLPGIQNVLWARIAKTHGRRSTGLRKFVWRRGELVEVRSRGRSGSRDLLTAIQEAGAAPCPQPIPLFKIELL